MSTQRHSVHVNIKDWKGKKVSNHTFHVSNNNRIDSHTFSDLPDGDYLIECNLPPGIELKSDSSTLKVREGEGTLSITLEELSNSKKFFSEESSTSSQKISSNGSFTPLLGASVASLFLLGNLKLPIDFFSKLSPPRMTQSQGVRATEKPSGMNSVGQSEATSLSVLDDKLRKCLITNIRDVARIPTLSGLARKVTLLTITDEEVRTEANLLYDKVHRLRKILKGCDPKLASDLIAIRNREANSTQSPYSNIGASGQLSQLSYPITISHCNGRLGSANFRSAPTLAEWAILGHVEQGQKAYLTGRTEAVDGEIWHEAIAPIIVVDPGKQVTPNQYGWIASCFVR